MSGRDLHLTGPHEVSVRVRSSSWLCIVHLFPSPAPSVLAGSSPHRRHLPSSRRRRPPRPPHRDRSGPYPRTRTRDRATESPRCGRLLCRRLLGDDDVPQEHAFQGRRLHRSDRPPAGDRGGCTPPRPRSDRPPAPFARYCAQVATKDTPLSSVCRSGLASGACDTDRSHDRLPAEIELDRIPNFGRLTAGGANFPTSSGAWGGGFGGGGFGHEVRATSARAKRTRRSMCPDRLVAAFEPPLQPSIIRAHAHGQCFSWRAAHVNG